MIISKHKKATAKAPTVELPPEDVRPDIPSINDPLEAKVDYVAYRASHDVPPSDPFTPDDPDRPHEIARLATEVKELAKDPDEHYAMAVAVNNHVYRGVGVKLSDVPVPVLTKYFAELEKDSHRLGTSLRHALRRFVISSTGAFAKEETLRDFMLERLVFPIAHPVLQIFPFTWGVDEELYNEARAAVWKDYKYNGRPPQAATFEDFKLMLLSPHCLQPRTVEAMHVVLLQAVTGGTMTPRGYEPVPDSIMRRHFADQTYKVPHRAILEHWEDFLIICQDMNRKRPCIFTGLAFTEFLCTGNVTAIMAKELEEVARYALTRWSTVIVHEALAEKAGVDTDRNFRFAWPA